MRGFYHGHRQKTIRVSVSPNPFDCRGSGKAKTTRGAGEARRQPPEAPAASRTSSSPRVKRFLSVRENNDGHFPPNWVLRTGVGMWPSLVGHCVRDAGVARSNRAIPTIFLSIKRGSPGGMFRPRASEISPRYPAAAAIWKMGRYMAIIIPPTTPPRKTIMNGSSRAVIAPTAASTSSS